MMTTSVDLSAELQDWIGLAGMDTVQGSQTDDGRTVIWNKGGEIRYFVDFVDRYYVITSSDRMDAERFHLGAATRAILEKYLCGHFGGSVRRLHGLQRVRRPFSRDELQLGYSIGKVAFCDRERDALIESSGTVLAIAVDDRLVELSHYIDGTIDTIKDSFLDPEGKPLFTPLV
jgi:hypothetical protein